MYNYLIKKHQRKIVILGIVSQVVLLTTLLKAGNTGIGSKACAAASCAATGGADCSANQSAIGPGTGSTNAGGSCGNGTTYQSSSWDKNTLTWICSNPTTVNCGNSIAGSGAGHEE